MPLVPPAPAPPEPAEGSSGGGALRALFYERAPGPRGSGGCGAREAVACERACCVLRGPGCWRMTRTRSPTSNPAAFLPLGGVNLPLCRRLFLDRGRTPPGFEGGGRGGWCLGHPLRECCIYLFWVSLMSNHGAAQPARTPARPHATSFLLLGLGLGPFAPQPAGAARGGSIRPKIEDLSWQPPCCPPRRARPFLSSSVPPAAKSEMRCVSCLTGRRPPACPHVPSFCRSPGDQSFYYPARANATCDGAASERVGDMHATRRSKNPPASTPPDPQPRFTPSPLASLAALPP
jgi:hypothetical protein